TCRRAIPQGSLHLSRRDLLRPCPRSRDALHKAHTPCCFGGRARGSERGLCYFRGPVKVNVYIDGFNLYYRALKGGPHKWLDLAAFAQKLLPSHQINRIRYFTALVKPRASDPQEPIRQQTYIRALRTIPSLTVHLGNFLEKPVSMLLEHPPPNGPRF